MNSGFRRFFLFIFLGILLGFDFSAAAQTMTSPLALSLNEALDKAFNSYEKLKISELQIEEAQGEVWQSYQLALPSLDADYRYTRNIKKPSIFFETETVPIGFDNEHTIRAGWLQPLTRFGGIYHGILSAKQAKSAAVYSDKQTQVDVVFEVKQAYFNVLLYQARYLVSKEDLIQAEEIAKRDALRFKVGEIAEFDYNRSVLEVENKKAELTQMEGNLKVALEKLKRLTNLPDAQEIKLTDSLEKFAKPIAADEARRVFESTNPAIESLQQRAKSADSARKAVRAEFFPRFSFFGNYDFVGQSSEHFFPDDQEITNAFAMGLNVDIPIFDGMLTMGRYKSYEARAQSAVYEKELQSKDLKLSLDQALIEAKTQLERLQYEKRSVELAETLYRQATIRSEQGMISFIDLKDVRNQLEQTRLRYVNSVYLYVISRAKVEQIVGVRELPYSP